MTVHQQNKNAEAKKATSDDVQKLLKQLHQSSADPVFKKFVRQYAEGRYDDQDARRALLLAINIGEEEKSDINLRALIGLLRNASPDPLFRKTVNAFVDGRFDDSNFRDILGLAFANENPQTAALDYIARTHSSSHLKAAVKTIREEGTESSRVQFLLRMFYQSSYAADLLATFASTLHFDDKTFNEAYEAGASVSAWGGDIRWRVHTLLHCAAHAAGIEGDFVECGVDRGGTALCVMRALGDEAFADRRFYLFDTFKGLVREQMTETEVTLNRSTDERFPDVLDEVRERFAPHPFVEIVQGIVPDTLPAFTGEKIAYLHIDLNISYPECAAFEYFWPRLSTGAPVIFDDYAFPSHIEQRKALDDLAAKLGTRIMALPTGQGLLWK